MGPNNVRKFVRVKASSRRGWYVLDSAVVCMLECNSSMRSANTAATAPPPPPPRDRFRTLPVFAVQTLQPFAALWELWMMYWDSVVFFQVLV